VRLDKASQLRHLLLFSIEFAVLGRLVAMKMNGPGMGPPLLWVLRLAGPGSMVGLSSMTPADGHCRQDSWLAG
jgi:hypothetical protein